MAKHQNKYKPQFVIFNPQDTLDYHELGILTSYDIEKTLSDFLEDSFINKLDQVLVITGKGNVVRPLVEKLLKINKHVDAFKQAGYFNGQSGAFEVIIKNSL